MANTKIVTFRASNHRQQRRIMESRLSAIQRQHPDARVISVNVSRRSALQWNPCKLEVTMVVEWADAPVGVGAAPTSGTPGGVNGRSNWSEWYDETGQMTTSGKVVLWLLFWWALGPWKFWKSQRFTTKTKAIVTAGVVAAIAVNAAFAPSEKTEPAQATTAESKATTVEAKVTTTTAFDAYTDSVTPAGVSCEELAGMWESARRDTDLVQGAKYVAAWEKYCTEYGSIATNAH